jgi:cysteine desulfurase/selenocysteine lyase
MVYLDNAATSSPKPRCVTDAVLRALTEINANPGRSGHARALEAGREVLDCRADLADLMGAADPLSVAFQFNCTDALNLAIKGSLRRGDHVVTTMIEHNSVLRVLKGLERTGQISLTLVNPGPDRMIDPDDIARAVTGETRLIALTHASNVTGAIQPVAAVCRFARELGIPSLVDGAQALGSMPVNVALLSCDLYAFPGHKGLLGPQGTGGLYIRPGFQLHSLREGGTGSSSESMYQPGELPEKFESGTLNYHGIAGLGAGVRHVAENLSQIFMRERELTTALYEAISAIEGTTVYSPAHESARAGIVSFNIGDLTSSQAADALDQAGFCVRGGLHCAPGAHMTLGTLRRGAVRASVGHATTFEEIEAFARAVSALKE